MLKVNNMSENPVEQASIDVINKNLVETQVRLLGDKTTIGQVVQLLAYIRHAIKYNDHIHLDVEIGKYVMNTPFAFDVNGQEIADLVPQEKTNIN